MSMEDEILAQAEITNRIRSFVSNYGKTPKERLTLGYIVSRTNGIKDLWLEYNTQHKIIVAKSTPESRLNNTYFTDDTYSQCENIYYDISGRIAQKHIELLAKANPQPLQDPIPQPNPSIEQLPIPVVSQDHIQIPRLNVPNFSGRYEDWTSFYDLFVAAVHSNRSIQPVHKLQYLKSLLTGDAEILLKQIPITADNYQDAWETLVERFDNKRILLNTNLRKLFSQKHVEESASGIRKLLDNTRECTNALKIQGIDISTWDCILIYIVSQHIPESSLSIWEQSIPRNQLPTFDQLLTFLENRFRILEFSPGQTNNNVSQNRSRIKNQSFHTTSSNCRICQGPQHPIRRCPKFLDMPPSQRLNFVVNSKLCRNCFAYSHQTESCKSTHNCSVCNLRHNSLLHINTHHPSSSATGTESPSNPQSSNNLSSTNQANAFVSRLYNNNATDIVLATALVTIKAFDGQSHSFRALLDNASQECFVSKQVVQFLGIKPNPTSITVSGVGQAQAPKPLGQVFFNFGSNYDSSFSMAINAIVLPVITYSLPTKPLKVDQNLISGLELADPTYGTPGTIDILLSASVVAALTMPCLRKYESTIALQSKLGWVLYGEAKADTSNNHRTCFHVSSEDHLSNVLQKFWNIEDVSSDTPLSKDDERCEQIFAETHTRNPDGRYTVNIPFRTYPPSLGSSRDRAVSRFLQTERKLNSNPNLREEYSKCINEYIKLGHMQLTSSSEDQHCSILPNGLQSYSSYYLPHHAVVKEDSTTTKTRVVFDASCKTTNGISLNDSMLIGPALQDSLFNLLIRWRSHKIVIKADIEKMYRQILVSDTHQQYQRIVWRNNPKDELKDYQLRTVTFGTASAPYLAIKTINQLADDEKTNFPIAASILHNDFYVDDLLSGADSVKEAIHRQSQVSQLLQRGGFVIRKWSSNHIEVTDQIEDAAKDLCKSSDSTLKALGILWCPRKDILSIKVQPPSNSVTTKRLLLSEVSKLFDPLGWIAPAIITSKILLQRLWLAGLNWDEPLPPEIQSDWNEFRVQLPLIEKVNINRWIDTSLNRPIQLHGFCDASERAYAAVVYIRVETSNNEWTTHLIAAKTRVAPVKQVSLPRLELCGAVLLAKLITSIQSNLKATVVHTWTDSEIVLAWLQGHPNRWKTFVANRVSDIHSTLDAAVWNHVPSKDNPADCASRGLPPQQLSHHSLWWNGPKWLTQNVEYWPRKPKHQIKTIQLERKSSAQTFISVATNDTLTMLLENCNSLKKAIRVVTRIRRWSKQSSQKEILGVPKTTVAKKSKSIHG